MSLNPLCATILTLKKLKGLKRSIFTVIFLFNFKDASKLD